MNESTKNNLVARLLEAIVDTLQWSAFALVDPPVPGVESVSVEDDLRASDVVADVIV